MRILPFVVNGQKLEKSDNESFESLIRGSTGYLKCSFTFDESWDGYTKAVEFLSTESSQYFFLNKDNTIDIPSNITSLPYFKVKLIGILDKESKFSTNAVLVKQKRGY